MMLTPLRNFVRKFSRSEDGTIGVEAAITMPLLLVTFAMGFVLFDAVRSQAQSLKTAHVLADILSRETNHVTPIYLNSLWKVQQELNSATTNTEMRVTVARWNKDQNKYNVVWSKVKGSKAPLTDSSLATDVQKVLPTVANGRVVIAVESWVPHTPVLDVGIDPFIFHQVAAALPRFTTSQLCWNDNEDQGVATQVC